jgi:hypothetical protein
MFGDLGSRARSAWAVLVLSGLAFAPGAARAADHRDAPGTKANGALDINDVYAFQSPTNAKNTVLITTVVPLAGVFNLPVFSATGFYDINVDNNGDHVADLTFRFAFSAANRLGVQKVAVQLITSHSTQLIAQDLTGNIIHATQGVTAAASLFDDPFFFDLLAFDRFLVSGNPNEFCGQNGVNPTNDFFKGLNTLALVLEVPSTLLLAASGSTMIAVWARTLDASGTQIDRMGRPAINTALIPPAMKNAFNAGSPSTDVFNFGGLTGPVMSTLVALGNSAATATALTGVLLPDVLTFDTSSSAGFLNGRRLPDDVIDAEFGLILANYKFHGVLTPITTDCVGNDSTFLPHFPYLGVPNPVNGQP